MKKIFTLMLLVLTMVGTAKADVEWTIFSGSMAAGNWAKSLDADATWCKALEAGDQLVGTATIDTGKESDYNIQLYYGDTYIADFTYSDGTISYTLTTDNITNLQTDGKGMKLKGKNFTLTSLKVKKAKSAIKTTISATGSSGDWTSNVPFPDNSLANAVEGDYVLVSLSSSASDSQGKVGMSSKGTDTYGFNEYVQAFAGIVTSDMAGESTKNGYVQGKNITVSGAALYHPLSSFSIGSIGYATFSASQQVTAPNTVTAYKATVDGSTVRLTQFTDNVIPANTGAIIAGDEGAVLEFTASSESTSETSDLIACTTATDVTTLAATGYDLYVLYSAHNSSDGSALLTGFGNWSDGTRPAWVSSSKTLTWSVATGNSQGGWVGADWSAYDYVKINISSNSLDAEASFNIAYQNSATTSSATLSAGSTDAVIIYLDATAKSNQIGNFQISSSTSASKSLTISSVELVTITPEFRKSTSGTLAANKAYLKISNSTPAPKLKVVIDEKNSTTGIANVGFERRMKDDNRIYNLNGQEVKNAGKGIFIKNGKKYIIK